MIYWEIYKQFLNSTNIDTDIIGDFRPCEQPYYDVDIPGAIIIWLKIGGKIIYVPYAGDNE